MMDVVISETLRVLSRTFWMLSTRSWPLCPPVDRCDIVTTLSQHSVIVTFMSSVVMIIKLYNNSNNNSYKGS